MTPNKSLESRSEKRSLSNRALYCFSLLLSLWSVHGSIASANYSEVIKLGSSCPALDSCTYLRTPSGRSQVKDSSCNCDSSCSEYGDCCIDAVSSSSLGSERNDLTCLHFEQSRGVYMKDSCPASFVGSQTTRDLCERSKLGDQADPLASLPVTDLLSGLTYKNFHCSLCNNANDAVMWMPKLECPLLSLMNKSSSITPAYVLENLATDGRGWGLYLNDESDGEEFFHDCHVYPVLPPRLQRFVRPCRGDLFSGCPPSWDRVEVRRMCEAYLGPRFDVDGHAYRNAHCAVCNGANTSALSCRTVEEVDIFRDFGTHSFALLLDISEATGKEVGRVRLCKRGEVYDPFFKKCRNVSCLPGFVRRGRRCIMRSPREFVKFYMSSSTRPTAVATTTTSTSNYRNVTFGSVYFHSTLENINASLPKT